MYVIKDNVIKLSVRGLVEFICRSGDIDNRTGGFSDVRLMQEGTRMHKKIQKIAYFQAIFNVFRAFIGLFSSRFGHYLKNKKPFFLYSSSLAPVIL